MTIWFVLYEFVSCTRSTSTVRLGARRDGYVGQGLKQQAALSQFMRQLSLREVDHCDFHIVALSSLVTNEIYRESQADGISKKRISVCQKLVIHYSTQIPIDL